MRVLLPNAFTPRDYQVPLMRYLDEGGKRAVCVWHRRGGKDLTAAHQTCKLMHRRKGAYWHVFPTAEQGRKALWEGFTKDGQRIMECVFPAAIRKSPSDWFPKAEMVVELKCGSLWRLVGSDKISLVGAGPVGVVFSEYAIAKPSAWNFIAPMLDENDGWACFITTPRGNNHAKKLYDMAKDNPDWFADLKTLYDTRAYPPERTMEEARARGMPEPLIRQEYLCDWTAALVGSVWGELVETLEKAGAIGVFEHGLDTVFSSWDLGGAGARGDETSVWLWRLAKGGVDFVDHYSAQGKPLSHYFDWLEARAQTIGYDYARHFLPHDARAKTLVTGVSVLEQFVERYGAGHVSIGPPMSLADGIQAGRWLLQQNVRFHARCAEGVEALKQYHYEYDEDRRTFSNRPLHDWSSNDADAFRYAACVVKVTGVLMEKAPVVDAAHESPLTLDNLWTLNEREGRAGGRRI